jgi:hypothetical protein
MNRVGTGTIRRKGLAMENNLKELIPDSQAHRVIAKFGRPRDLCRALALVGEDVRDPSVVYRWTYGKPGGTGGLIPNAAIPAILKAARLQGIMFTEEDLRIRPLEWRGE